MKRWQITLVLTVFALSFIASLLLSFWLADRTTVPECWSGNTVNGVTVSHKVPCAKSREGK